jgi:hypoxanthine phosphoribosyltransferase
VEQKQEYYTWQEFEKDVEIISQQIKKRGWGLKNIYGLPRGGLILAVCLSHRLDIPLLSSSKHSRS